MLRIRRPWQPVRDSDSSRSRNSFSLGSEKTLVRFSGAPKRAQDPPLVNILLNSFFVLCLMESRWPQLEWALQLLLTPCLAQEDRPGGQICLGLAFQDRISS